MDHYNVDVLSMKLIGVNGADVKQIEVNEADRYIHKSYSYMFYCPNMDTELFPGHENHYYIRKTETDIIQISIKMF